jgi:hypothetical protein
MKQKGRHSTRKRKLAGSLKAQWESKVLHGQYIICADRQLIGSEDNFLWLLSADVKAETGCEIISAQDQALKTKYNSTKILQMK